MKFVVLALSLILAGCGTTQSYSGPKLGVGEAAELRPMKYSEMGFKTRYKAYLLTQVNDKTVGGYYRGYPSRVELRPGKNVVKVEYHHNLDTSLVSSVVGGGVLAGAVGGAVAGATSNAMSDKNFVSVEFDAKAGHKYSVLFYPNLISGERTVPMPWVYDNTVGEVVFGTVPPAVNDPSGSWGN